MWVLIEALQQDEAMAKNAIVQNARGQPPIKRVKRATVQLQSRLHSLCADRQQGRKSVAEALQGLGHNIRLSNN